MPKLPTETSLLLIIKRKNWTRIQIHQIAIAFNNKNHSNKQSLQNTSKNTNWFFLNSLSLSLTDIPQMLHKWLFFYE